MVKVAVIGAGWYGCHLALEFIRAGHKVSVFEAGSEPLTGAASNNQLRLHHGFHYLRNAPTRRQSINGYSRFLEEYPSLSVEIKNNFYVVPEAESWLDFETISLILTAENIPFERTLIQELPYLRGISGAIISNERLILPTPARQLFTDLLGDNLLTSHEVDLEELDLIKSSFDLVIDATYLGLSNLRGVTYELTYLPILTQSNKDLPFGALTLIDGEFWSIYPTESQFEFSLSNVKFSPLRTFTSKSEALEFSEKLQEDNVNRTLDKMTKQVEIYWPVFKDYFKFSDKAILQTKVKPLNKSADRSALFSVNKNLITIQCGKLDAIFPLTDELFKNLGIDRPK